MKLTFSSLISSLPFVAVVASDATSSTLTGGRSSSHNLVISRQLIETLDETCTCNLDEDALMKSPSAGGIPPLNVSKQELTYSNVALEAAHIGLSLIPGTGGEPHKIAMLGAVMYEAIATLPTSMSDTGVSIDRMPLSDAGKSMKMGKHDHGDMTTMSMEDHDMMMMTDMMSDEDVSEYVGYAAYGALRRVLGTTPDKVSLLDEKMTSLGFNSSMVMEHATAPFVMSVLMKYSLGPMSDYTPANPASTQLIDSDCDALVDPTKWQAQCLPTSGGGEECAPQQIPFGPFFDAKLIVTDGQRNISSLIEAIPSAPTTGQEYIDQHRTVLEASSTLADEHKFLAEFFQPNGAVIISKLAINEAEARSLSLEESIDVFFGVTGSMRDSVAGSVTIKLQQDSVRPLTVLQCNPEFQGDSVMAWNRPYLGVRNITNEGDDLWRPYLQTPPFPGYTSGHAGVAGAGSTMLSKFFPDGMLAGNNCAMQLIGMSRTEPRIDIGEPGYIEGVTDVPNEGPMTVGFSPANDVTLCWPTYENFAASLAESRLLGGIHIPIDNDVGLEWGKTIGAKFYDFMMSNREVSTKETESPTAAPTMKVAPEVESESLDLDSSSSMAPAVFEWVFAVALVAIIVA